MVQRKSTVTNDDGFNKVENNEELNKDDADSFKADNEDAEGEKKEDEEIDPERLPIGDDYYVIAFCSTLNKAK